MSKKLEKIEEAILKYQEKKRKLVLTYTGVDLIPSSVAIKQKDLSESQIEVVIREFRGLGNLSWLNCLHCVVYAEGVVISAMNVCHACPYEIAGFGCLTKVNTPYSKATVAINTLSKVRYINFSKALEKLGKELEKEIQIYKEQV